MLSRRTVLVGGAAAIGVMFAGGGLVEAGVIPGKHRLDTLLHPAGDVPPPPDADPGPVERGSFRSPARKGIEVGYTIYRPPGAPGAGALPMVITMHGRGGDHTWLGTLGIDRYLADAVTNHGVPPFAVVTVDGGDAVNWHPRADGDDPPAMITGELLPRLAGQGLRTERVGLWGWSLGGYGTLLLASDPGATSVAVACAVSPALWRRYADSAAGTFDGAADFNAHDVFSRLDGFGHTALRVDCGEQDPFATADAAFRAALPHPPDGTMSPGDHDNAYWVRQLPDQLAYLGAHLR